MTPSPRAHIPQFDLLRGAAILAVVYLHAYFTPWPEASHSGQTLLHAVHLVAHGAVPLFLFIAAYLQAAGPRESVLEHLRGRAWAVWLPAALWMIATLAYRLVRDGSSLTLWRDLALFDISGQFYFIWLLLVFGAAATQLWRIPADWWPRVVAFAFAVNLVAIGWYASQDSIGGTFATLAYRNPLAWVFFPVLGYALGRTGRASFPRPAVLAATALMAVAAAAYLWIGIAFDRWPVSYFGLTVFLFSAGAMFVYPTLGARLVEVRRIARPLVALSPYAFSIYLVHLPFVIGFGTRELLGDGADWSNYWLLLHANAAVGFFVSLAVVREVDKLSPWLAAKALGVRRRVRPTSPPTPNPATRSPV
jgi:peptidoglycan/LPS O-acetylase OafA/YrhL